MDLMEKGVLEGWCWQTTETAALFMQDDAIIYRMHVRGFTAHKSSGTRYKGTFKGIKADSN